MIFPSTVSEVVFSDTNFEIFSCTVFSEYSSAEWFGTEFQEFASIYSTERKSELFSLPLKGSEGNSESLLLFLFHRRNSELFSLPWNSLEGNSESLLLFASFLYSMERGILSCFLLHERVWYEIPKLSCSVYFFVRNYHP
jgi:hypothetical protein